MGHKFGFRFGFPPSPAGRGEGRGLLVQETLYSIDEYSSWPLLPLGQPALEQSFQLQTSFTTSVLSNSNLKGTLMAKNFSDLRAGISQAARERSDENAIVMLAEMPLNELRQARGLSQKMLTDVLDAQQSSIAKFEKRTDMN